MVRMSFLGHLEELRRRIIYILVGFGVCFLACLVYCKELWNIISEPAVGALMELGVKPPTLSQLTPMEGFNVIWVKVPVLCSIFLSSPWLIYQVWAFIAPGLYKRERRWAVPFVLCTAGLFITGGLFAYYVAFRYGLVFLLGVGRDVHVTPLVSINEYFDLFVNVTLGIGLVFELPILIFFLALLRIVTAGFLLKHSRYAILAIFIIAAVVTPTPDVFNLMLFATPMCLLFYVGILAAYLLQMSREGRKLPWPRILMWIGLGLVVLAGVASLAILKFGYKLISNWPFLAR
ncbi:MAG TPA: twin-arginine translocase subunit TatC [Solibacterales bacterium]|nr:twin-arginine translocase subunit TatC [Bryobacterales bacterium]